MRSTSCRRMPRQACEAVLRNCGTVDESSVDVGARARRAQRFSRWLWKLREMRVRTRSKLLIFVISGMMLQCRVEFLSIPKEAIRTGHGKHRSDQTTHPTLEWAESELRARDGETLHAPRKPDHCDELGQQANEHARSAGARRRVGHLGAANGASPRLLAHSVKARRAVGHRAAFATAAREEEEPLPLDEADAAGAGGLA